MLDNYEYKYLSITSPAYKSYGYVIKIVDDRTILVSLTNKSVAIGDLIEVYENLAPIIDPINNLKLGMYSIAIEEFVVTDTFKDYSICKINKKSYNVLTNLVSALNPLIDENEDESIQRLNPDQNESLKPTKQFVSVKDPVRVSRGNSNYRNFLWF